MATHSSVLAWRIPGKGEPGGLPSLGLQRVGHDWSDLAAAAASHSKRYMHSHFTHLRKLRLREVKLLLKCTVSMERMRICPQVFWLQARTFQDLSVLERPQQSKELGKGAEGRWSSTYKDKWDQPWEGRVLMADTSLLCGLHRWSSDSITKWGVGDRDNRSPETRHVSWN